MAAVTYRVGDKELSAEEMMRLGARSPDTFYKLFFPKTARQKSPSFHLELDAVLDDPSQHFVHARMFRGSAKTTRLRMFTARRIAYALSRTILYIGASEGHGARSIKWLRRQIEVNKVLTGVFQLEPGSKWQETELEIVNRITGTSTWVMGAGYTGNIRGINFDDYRPDLIILDDVLTDENSATLDQREKVIDLIEGALKGSLAPETEEPNAKMVMLQTPMHAEDASSEIARDPTWRTIDVPIWTRETLDLPADQQVSVWEERLPTSTVRAMKQGYAQRNRLSIWAREFEVRLVTPEQRAFRTEWLQIVNIMPAHTMNVLAIDPVPPPSEIQIEKGFAKKDFEALAVVGRYEDKYFLREYSINRGHEPNWTISELFRLAQKWRVVKIVIETIAYQRTLKWLFEQEMRRRGIYYVVEGVSDKRKKYHKIVSSLSGIASQSQFFCLESHTDFISQFTDYPKSDHDDILDAVALALSRIINPVLEVGAEEYAKIQVHGRGHKIPRLRGAP